MDPDISIRDRAWEEIGNLEELACEITKLTLAEFHKTEADLSISFVDDETIASLNAQWRQKPKPTNVLSFPAPPHMKLDSEAEFLGDIIIASGVTRQEAEEQGKTWKGHVSHLILHGVLHLLGKDHETSEDAIEMESIEIAILAKLGHANPYEIHE
jgi:probable rRNA maturation factor